MMHIIADLSGSVRICSLFFACKKRLTEILKESVYQQKGKIRLLKYPDSGLEIRDNIVIPILH